MSTEKKTIWFTDSIMDQPVLPMNGDTLGEHLGMEWVNIGPDSLSAKMPVDKRTHQPYGLLHGGASCALAETVGSVASHLVIDPAKYYCVGLEINANHLRSVKSGFVMATARPLHIGRTTHVWDIRITDERDKLVCISRLTVAILKK